MNIGDRIRCARENAGLTQQELGKLCGTTKQTIYKYESGIVTNIPLDRVETIAAALNVTSASLLGWEKKEQSPVENKGLNLDNISETQRFIIDAVLKMPEDRQKALAKILGLAE